MHSQTNRVITISAILAMTVGIGTARAEVCVAIDEAHDSFSPHDRSAALLLLSKQFELQGEHVAPAPCATQYTLAHVQLGETIAVSLSGPRGSRDATAFGLNDIPAVYNQMVRSLLTGRPMALGGVIDRTNVSAVQTTSLRVYADSVFYARLGFGAIVGDEAHGTPAATLLGYRHELDAYGIDVSFLSFQNGGSSSYSSHDSAWSGTWVKLEGLRFRNPRADASAYFGGGLSWTGASIDDGFGYWSGSGLQGEVTVGYELGRASKLRMFVQTDIGLPFYSLTLDTYMYSPYPRTPPSAVPTHRQYAPSVAVSVGLGWQRGDAKHR